MKLSGFILWMCASNNMFLSSALPSALSITKCEILEYTSMTCYWDTSDHANSSYRLHVKKLAVCQSEESLISEDGCETSGTQCSIQPIKSTFHCFCADVSNIARSIRSAPFCFKGANQVKLLPLSITRVGPSAERPGCFQVDWKISYSITDYEKSHRRIQVEYTSPNQTRSRTIQKYSEDRLELCDLYPGSRYTVKLRVQDSRASSHWSSWTSKDFMTVEKAPSAAPRLWRCIRPAEETRKRRLTLHWKPLSWPEANGVVLSYTASCRRDVDSSQWTCGTLDASKTSCDLTVSDDACTCSLTATNSAGTSPQSYINIPGHTEAELPPPESLSVVSLDETRLQLEWTTAPNQSESGFVVQWISILDNGTTCLYWQHLNETYRRFMITGLLPEIPYNVSVIGVYGVKSGIDTPVIAFTREGAPSVGPKLTVLQTGGRSIHLRWNPVPIAKLHGFIKFYSILYSINGIDKREQVNGAVDQISLSGLMEGTYNICVMAHTVAGGAAGPCQMVAVGYEDVQVIPMLLCALLLIFIILIIPVCMRVRITKCLCPIVPDPSNSSLSVWCKPSQHKGTPSTTASSFFSIVHTSFYHGYGEKDNGPVQVLSFHPVQQILDDARAKANTYNSTSAETYVNPRLRTDQPTHFQADFINRSYTKPNQIMSDGYQDDFRSLTNPLTYAVLSYQSDPTLRDDLCDNIHVSQSYMSGVDEYRTLNADECSHALRGLPEDHNI